MVSWMPGPAPRSMTCAVLWSGRAVAVAQRGEQVGRPARIASYCCSMPYLPAPSAVTKPSSWLASVVSGAPPASG